MKNLSKALRILEFNAKSAQVQEIEIEDLKENEILIKTLYTPIAPLDILKIGGKLPAIKCPFTPGTECFGEIIGSGDGCKELIGKKVSCFVPLGACKGISIANKDMAIIYPTEVDPKLAAFAFVNPLTSYGLLKKKNAGGVINNAANSALGRMLLRMCKLQGIPIVNIVRSEGKRKELMEQEGAEIVLNSSSEGFLQDLQGKIKEFEIKTFYDAVGGELSGKILKIMNPDSKLLVYGTMSGQSISNIDGTDLRWSNKEIVGSVLFKYLSSLTTQEREEAFAYVRDNLTSIFNTSLLGMFKPEEYATAFEKFAANPSEGKYLITFE